MPHFVTYSSTILCLRLTLKCNRLATNLLFSSSFWSWLLFFQLLPKSCSLNYISTAIIKQCSCIFHELIAYLSNLSSQVSCPSLHFYIRIKQWLFVSTDFLVFDPTVFAYFRPISNLNNMCKILMRLFLARLQPHIISSPNFMLPWQWPCHSSFYHTVLSMCHFQFPCSSHN